MFPPKLDPSCNKYTSSLWSFAEDDYAWEFLVFVLIFHLYGNYSLCPEVFIYMWSFIAVVIIYFVWECAWNASCWIMLLFALKWWCTASKTTSPFSLNTCSGPFSVINRSYTTVFFNSHRIYNICNIKQHIHFI